MRVRYRWRAQLDIEKIHAWIEKRNPRADYSTARKTGKRSGRLVERLCHLDESGERDIFFRFENSA